MATAKDNEGLIKGRRVGKKRQAVKKKPVKPREQFAARLRALAGDRTTIEIGDLLGVSPNTVGKWLKGHRVPDLDEWPAIAEVFGLEHWTELLPR